MTTILPIALGILSLILFYTTWNAGRKLEEAEDVVEMQQQYITKFSETVAYCRITLDEIDSKGTFASDDEVGFFFEELKKMGDLLNQYDNEQ